MTRIEESSVVTTEAEAVSFNKERHLSPEVARSEIGKLALVAAHGRGPFHDHAELMGEPALLGQSGAGRDVDGVDVAGDLAQVFLAESREERDLGQILDLGGILHMGLLRNVVRL
jgi:hypothetical protein